MVRRASHTSKVSRNWLLTLLRMLDSENALRRVPRSAAHRATRYLAASLNYHLIRRSYYSGVPDLETIPDLVWEEANPLRGLKIDVSSSLSFLETDLAPYFSEFQPPLLADEDAGAFFLANGSYGPVDAEVLYAFIRHFKPHRVLELGSGFSSLVISDACEKNKLEGHDVEYVAVDPHPGPLVSPRRPLSLREIREITARDIPLEEFEALESGDVLFVDTTHTVTLGNEVVFLVLDVLPVLRPGVIVHFHDIFLPWHYPREWFADHQYYWAEQYLLQAFLAFNATYDVVYPANLLARSHAERLRTLIPSFDLCRRPGPGAFWLRRSDHASSDG
jgi:predicted O-methyltransferase YrrM